MCRKRPLIQLIRVCLKGEPLWMVEQYCRVTSERHRQV